MLRHLYILIGFLLLAGSLFAESELPVIEIKADRTMIYPQRMELTGEESLMDILQMEGEISQKHSDTRNNTNACVIFVPDNRNQIQLGYYRKYYNPSYLVLFTNANTLIDEVWARSKGLLEEWDINQVKLAYAYSKQKLTVQTEASYYAMLTGMICLMHSVVKQK